MEVLRDTSAFLAEPLGRALVARQHVIWSASPTQGGTIVWGDCGLPEAEAITRAWDYEARFATPYDAVVDMSDLSFIEPSGFRVVERDMRGRLPVLAQRIRRQALVRPRGMAGAIVAGFYPMLAPSFDWRVFDRREDAYAWAFGADGPALLEQLEELVASERAAADDVARLRDAMRNSIEEAITLATVARSIGRSARSLQRTLADAGTTFRAEAARVRVERAREMLERSELKVESIARAVGMRSPSSFVATFRALTGMTPHAYRRARVEASEHGPRPVPP